MPDSCQKMHTGHCLFSLVGGHELHFGTRVRGLTGLGTGRVDLEDCLSHQNQTVEKELKIDTAEKGLNLERSPLPQPRQVQQEAPQAHP